MKKAISSVAFILASGAYVVAANNFSNRQPAADVDVATAPMRNELSTSVTATEPARVPAPVRLPQPPVRQALEQPVLEALGTQGTAVPPLPRPRPISPAATHTASISKQVSKAAGFADGVYAGTQEDAYYGQVKVQITISAHQVVAVKVLDYPQDRRTSRSINSRALPILRQEAVAAATTANIDVVSGATLTSGAYIQSLRSALRQAGGNG